MAGIAMFHKHGADAFFEELQLGRVRSHRRLWLSLVDRERRETGERQPQRVSDSHKTRRERDEFSCGQSSGAGGGRIVQSDSKRGISGSAAQVSASKCYPGLVLFAAGLADFCIAANKFSCSSRIDVSRVCEI